MAERFSVVQAAAKIGVSKATLQRWEREKRTPPAHRDRNNWRSYSLADIETIKQWAQKVE